MSTASTVSSAAATFRKAAGPQPCRIPATLLLVNLHAVAIIDDAGPMKEFLRQLQRAVAKER
jgi:hypothetical protein